jgi:hypothetical protein
MNSTVATLPMFRAVAVTAEQGYLASIQAFRPSFELLVAAGNEHVRASALVGGLMVECLLKAYLVHISSNPDEPTKTRQGHDLELLWSDAVQAGLTIDAKVPAWCVVLNCLHFGNKDPQNTGAQSNAPVDLRYPLRYQSKMNGLSFPVPSELHAGVLSLLQAVNQALSS